jgi:hypothetical protein
MVIEKIDISKIKQNSKNPRIIKDNKFEKLVKSIKGFPEMLEVRPIVVDDDMVVLGGNQRLKACKEAGMKEVPIIRFKNLTEDQKKEFIIKDNTSSGEWDFELLEQDWDIEILSDMGIDIEKTDFDVDEFFIDKTADESGDVKKKIILEYTDNDYDLFMENIKKYSGTKEAIILKLLEGE